ncbi:MAG: FtsX-like permease family protein [Gemmatimonadota bacterium]|nr:FtsX-like permease family protein [Gemmatimonadota bacterium]
MKYSHEYRQGALVVRSAIVAILLACLGVAGLAAFAAERRTREIAIRKVLGASEGHLLLRVAREFPMLALLAGAAACPFAYLLARDWLRNFAYRIDLTVWPFLLSMTVTLLIAVVTVVRFARQAARTNPVDVLSQE